MGAATGLQVGRGVTQVGGNQPVLRVEHAGQDRQQLAQIPAVVSASFPSVLAVRTGNNFLSAGTAMIQKNASCKIDNLSIIMSCAQELPINRMATSFSKSGTVANNLGRYGPSRI